MFKRMIQTLAAAVLMGSTAFAGDVAGTYSTQTAKGPLVIEIHHDGQRLAGVIHYCDMDMPLTGNEYTEGTVGQVLNGAYSVQGKSVAFNAFVMEDSVLAFETAGTKYRLQKNTPEAYVPVKIAPAPEAPAANAQPNSNAASPLHTGKMFQYQLPENWTVNETQVGAVLTAPDKVTTATASVFIGQGATTPKETFAKLLETLPRFGCENVKVIMEKELSSSGGAETIAYGLRYDLKGTPMKSMVVVRILNKGKEYLAYLKVIEAPVATFDRDADLTLDLASSIQPISFEKLMASQRQLRADAN